MGLSTFTTRLATILVLHAAGAGLASPTVLVSARHISRYVVEWLPNDNQTLYKLNEGEHKRLELNTSAVTQRLVYITISVCSKDIYWALYQGLLGGSNDHLSLLIEYNGADVTEFSVLISRYSRYVLQMNTVRGSAMAVSVRGEPTRQVRLRLRVRSRRRLAANWDHSPIDPQSTKYCIVASHKRNYTSFCAARYEFKTNRFDNQPNELDRLNEELDQLESAKLHSGDVNNALETEVFNIYDSRSVYRRKKSGRSTKVTRTEPIIVCVGDKAHHMFENLDRSLTYYVSVFGIASDRGAGSLLATGSVPPRTSTAKRLRENVPSKWEIRGRSVYYFKTSAGNGGGLWMMITTCAGAVDVEVTVRGKRVYWTKNIEPHKKFFVPAPISASSMQEGSDEGSVLFDSSSEEARMKYVIRVTPSRSDRDGIVGIELIASTSRWGVNTPELLEDGNGVRELRQRRSCRSVEVAFLPAIYNYTTLIRYCMTAREYVTGEIHSCALMKKSAVKVQCITRMEGSQMRAIVQKISGLKPGKKYVVQVTASHKGSSVPYDVLYTETNSSCKRD